VKILAFGDAQLGAHGRLDDQADVLDRIATLAIDRNVGLVLNGGDTFEGGEIKPADLRVFADFIARLRDAGIPCLTVLGNGRHDRHRSADGVSIFNEIPGVTVAATPDVYRFGGCTVGAMPWVSAAWLQAHFGAAASRAEVNAHMVDILVGQIAPGLLEDCRRVAPALSAVLLTHFAISGASLPTGLPVDLLSEPVLPLAELEAIGFDAVVASHIHKPQLLTSELGGGPVFFTGSPMAHGFGEADFDHGVWILDDMRPEFVPVESRKLVTLDYADVESLGADRRSFERLDEPVSSLDDAIVRVRFPVTPEELRRVDVPALRRELLDAGAHSVRIEPQVIRADRARVQGLDEGVSELDALEEWFRANTVEDGLAERMRAKTCEFLETVS
jgi:DNA repair exonuclease SbcCD nuclease subunit